MKSQTYFTVTGTDFIASEFSEAVSLRPDEAWKRGDSRVGTAAKYAHGGWSVSQKAESPVIDVGKSLEAMLDVIEPYKTEIAIAIHKFSGDAELSCMVFTDGNQTPIVHFDAAFLKRVAAIGAEIDVDVIVT